MSSQDDVVSKKIYINLENSIDTEIENLKATVKTTLSNTPLAKEYAEI